MGHATIEMTMRYAHLSLEVKLVAVEVLDRTAFNGPCGHMNAVGSSVGVLTGKTVEAEGIEPSSESLLSLGATCVVGVL